jgi:uncharacterized membrane protein
MIVLVWIHLVAAVAWIGGTLFLTLVLVPTFKRNGFNPERRALFHALARRFRAMVWSAVLVLVLTGPVLVELRFGLLRDPSAWPSMLKAKVALVVLLIGLTLMHDLWLGPLVSRIASHLREATETEKRFVPVAAWVARGALVLGLAVLLAAVALVRS